MKQVLTSNRIIYLILFCSTAAGYFAITDLQISIFLVNKNAGWAIFLEKFGEIPGLLILFIGIHLYLAQTLSFRKVVEGTKSTILFLAVLFITTYIVIVIYFGITGGYDLLIGNSALIIVRIAIFNLAIYFFFSKKKLNIGIIHFSKITVLLGLYSYLFLIQPIKILWGRVRFRDLDSIYSNFTDWFIVSGITGDQSFPSGHSAMGWMLLPLLILFSKDMIKHYVLLAIISLWAVSVGLSRIVVGAHYASDVLFGAFIVILVYKILINKYLKG